jgi:hypothetical protein
MNAIHGCKFTGVKVTGVKVAALTRLLQSSSSLTRAIAAACGLILRRIAARRSHDLIRKVRNFGIMTNA